MYSWWYISEAVCNSEIDWLLPFASKVKNGKKLASNKKAKLDIANANTFCFGWVNPSEIVLWQRGHSNLWPGASSLGTLTIKSHS